MSRIYEYTQTAFDWDSLVLDDNSGPSGSQAWSHRQLAAQYTGGLRSEPTLGALTGGSLSLDSLVTAGGKIATGAIRLVVLSGVLSHYRLVAGTDAESSPLVIRPDDYHAGTNARVWKLLDHAVGYGAISITSVALAVQSLFSNFQVATDIQDLASKDGEEGWFTVLHSPGDGLSGLFRRYLSPQGTGDVNTYVNAQAGGQWVRISSF